MEKYFDTRMNQSHRIGAQDVWRLVSAHILSRLGSKVTRVLDLGAGYGDFVNQVVAEEKWAADQWDGLRGHVNPGVKTVIGDIREALPGLPEKYFDLCFMSNVLEHFTIEDAENVLREVKKVLSPKGYLVLVQPNFALCGKNYFDDYTHKTIFTADGLANFLEDHGFQVTVNQPRFLPFSFKSRLPRPPWAVRLYLLSPWKPMAGQLLMIAKPRMTSSDA